MENKVRQPDNRSLAIIAICMIMAVLLVAPLEAEHFIEDENVARIPREDVPNSDKVYLSKPYIYLIGDKEVDMVDISDPTDPLNITTIEVIKNYTRSYLTSLIVHDNWLYTGDSLGGFWIVDISDLDDPHVTSSIRIENETGRTSWISAIVVVGEYAYLSHHNGLSILDIGQKDSPKEIGRYNTTYAAEDIVVQGKFAYMAESVLMVFYIEDRSRPLLLSTYDYNEDEPYGIWSLSMHGSTVYCVALGSFVFAVDVSNPESPTEIWRWEGHVQSIYIKDSRLYIILNYEVYIFDLHKSSNPSERGSFIHFNDHSRNATADGDFIYFASWWAVEIQEIHESDDMVVYYLRVLLILFGFTLLPIIDFVYRKR